jgi:hypothetical protein
MDVETPDRSALAALIHYRHSVEATETVEEVERLWPVLNARRPWS